MMTNRFEYLDSSPVVEINLRYNFDDCRRIHGDHSNHTLFSMDFEIILNQALVSLLTM